MVITPQMNVRLILDGAGNRRVVPVGRFPFTIGRGVDRDLSLPHPQVSREHARIEREADGYLLRDTSSRHGTFVNGIQISTRRLRSGDAITLGASRDVLLFEEDEETTTRSLIVKVSQTGPDAEAQNDLEKLSLFLKAAQSLNSFGAINDVLRTMLEYAIRLTGAERGFVFLGESADNFRLECGQDQDGNVVLDHSTISYSAVRDAAGSQLDFVISDVTDDLAQGRHSLILNAIRSVVAIPLRCDTPARLLGLLYLDSRSSSHDFSRTSKEILHAIAHQAATLLENLRLLEMERESALMRKELEIAASIQSQIIPQKLPEFAFARLSARTVPCTGVGGDFYDVIPVRNGFVAIVADVCGKGVPAALLASMVQGRFHGQVGMQTAGSDSLADAVQAVNAFVYARTPPEKYVTLAVLRYTHSDSGEAQIELVNGGHVAPIIVRADGRVEITSDGDLPVGLLDFARFHVVPLTLAAGDRIVLLSDGITEAEDAEGTQFGMVELQRHLIGPDPVTSLFCAIDRFCHGAQSQDDQTVLAIHCIGSR